MPDLTPAQVRALMTEVDHLREVCAAVHQAFGALAEHAGMFDHPNVVKVLDLLYAASGNAPVPVSPIDAILPFPSVPFDARAALTEAEGR